MLYYLLDQTTFLHPQFGIFMTILTLLTDFGEQDGFIGMMKGVIFSIAPQVTIVDITHQVAPQNIRQGAFLLAQAAPYFPRDHPCCRGRSGRRHRAPPDCAASGHPNLRWTRQRAFHPGNTAGGSLGYPYRSGHPRPT